MTDTLQRPPLPDRLSTDTRSPHYVAAVVEHEIGIRLNNSERKDVEEYCISEGWVKVPAGIEDALTRRPNVGPGSVTANEWNDRVIRNV